MGKNTRWSEVDLKVVNDRIERVRKRELRNKVIEARPKPKKVTEKQRRETFQNSMDEMVKKPKQSKYRNVKCEVDRITFDSKKEAKRYGELKLLEKAGAIRHLDYHKTFQITVNGIKICKYEADFYYMKVCENEINEWIIEDVKSSITKKNPTYRLKNKLVAAIYGIKITER